MSGLPASLIVLTDEMHTCFSVSFRRDTHKGSYRETDLNCKHVWGFCESRCSSSTLQLEGDQQGVKMYHSDARQHYK